MEAFSLFDGVGAIKVYLYTHNYIDRKILSKLQSKTTHFVKNDSSNIVISTEEIINLLHTEFKKEVGFLRDLPAEGVYKNVNSIYFLDKLTSQFPNLKYMEFSISNFKSYSRIKNEMSVVFDYKILEVQIDLRNFGMNYVDSLLLELKYEENLNMKNYAFNSNDFAERIDMFGASPAYNEKYENLLSFIEVYLEEKVLTDNAPIILILN